MLSSVVDTPATSAAEADNSLAAEDLMQVDDTRKPSPSHSQADVLVHYVMSELLRVAKPSTIVTNLAPALAASQASTQEAGTGVEETKEAGVSRKGVENAEEHLYTCVLMQTLAELLASYDSCKAAFITFQKKRSTAGPVSKHRVNFLVFLLNELTTSTAGLPTDNVHRRASFSNLANSVIGSLCSDIVTPQGVKEPSEELTAARKFVLDALAKAMKDVTTCDLPDLRYAKLHTLAELCTRLLTYRTATTATPTGVKEETSVHIAKIMLEKNFVSILTGALAEADLNHPSMKSLVGVIMRPLEQL